MTSTQSSLTGVWRKMKRLRSPINRSYNCLQRLYSEKVALTHQQEFDKQTGNQSPRNPTLPTIQHQNDILSIINDLPEKLLRSLKEMECKQTLVENILKFRFKNGKISELNDLIENKITTFECLQAMCTDLKYVELLHKDFCFPGLLQRQIQNLQSLVVIDIETLMSVSWIKVNRDGEVENWDHAMLIEDPKVKMSDHVLHYQLAKAAVARIPKGCMFVIRDTSRLFQKTKLTNSMDELHYKVMYSVFMTVLKSSLEKDTSEVYVVDMKKLPDIYNTDVVKHFDIRYMNSYKYLKSLMRHDDLGIQLPSVPDFTEAHLKEQYASVALLANSFYKLVLCDR
ncbi:uncharacterized protein [Argopecten irradians]|uniref:uncharacterized protein n=1 Tax=Argopecten irradians TaxID=31199 RepID=UPI00371D5F8A